MKMIYNVLCAFLILVLLASGMISLFDRDAEFSHVEDRTLLTFPEFSFSDILDGSFRENLELYYADTFPGREGKLDTADWLSRILGYAPIPAAEETE